MHNRPCVLLCRSPEKSSQSLLLSTKSATRNIQPYLAELWTQITLFSAHKKSLGPTWGLWETGSLKPMNLNQTASAISQSTSGTRFPRARTLSSWKKERLLLQANFSHHLYSRNKTKRNTDSLVKWQRDRNKNNLWCSCAVFHVKEKVQNWHKRHRRQEAWFWHHCDQLTWFFPRSKSLNRFGTTSTLLTDCNSRTCERPMTEKYLVCLLALMSRLYPYPDSTETPFDMHFLLKSWPILTTLHGWTLHKWNQSKKNNECALRRLFTCHSAPVQSDGWYNTQRQCLLLKI